MDSRFKIILIICLISSLSRFVLDIYLPSLPAISQYFLIPDSSTQLTLTMYLLGFSLSQLIYGPLSDRYGRRYVIISGIAIFLIGNIICSIATQHLVLLLARFIAGVGAGACGVLNRAIASDYFQGPELSRAWSYTTTTLVITLIVAPVLGGYMQEKFGWRSNFMLATFFIFIVFFIVLKFLPETRYNTTQHSSFKLQQIFQNYYHILTAPTFILCTLSYTLAFSGLIAYFQISPLLLINIFGLTPSQYGWSSLIIAGSYLIGGLLVNTLANYVSMRCLLILGAILLISGGAMMLVAYFFQYKNLVSILIPSAIYVIGARIIIPNALAGAMQDFRHLGGSSSALIGSIQMLGSAFVSYIITNFDYANPSFLAYIFIILGMMMLFMISFIKPLERHAIVLETVANAQREM